MVQNSVNKANWIQYVSMVLIVVLGLGLYGVVGLIPTAEEISENVESPGVNIDVEALANAVSAKMPTPEPVTTVTVDGELVEVKQDNSKIDEIYDEMFKRDLVESIAEELALDELESKDFRRDLVVFLMNHDDTDGVLEDMDYRDIGEYTVKNIEVLSVEGTHATVEIEFKVSVSNYGDEDEEERARVIATFDVRDLDEDDEYEDAEVNGFDIEELVRFYD